MTESLPDPIPDPDQLPDGGSAPSGPLEPSVTNPDADGIEDVPS
jgi:hypothetical protein